MGRLYSIVTLLVFFGYLNPIGVPPDPQKCGVLEYYEASHGCCWPCEAFCHPITGHSCKQMCPGFFRLARLHESTSIHEYRRRYSRKSCPVTCSPSQYCELDTEECLHCGFLCYSLNLSYKCQELCSDFRALEKGRKSLQESVIVATSAVEISALPHISIFKYLFFILLCRLV